MADKPSTKSTDPRGSTDSAMKLHQQLAQGKPIQTGAGKGYDGGKEPAPSRW